MKTDALLLCVYSILYDYYVVCYIFGATTRRGPLRACAPLSHGTNDVCTLTILFLVDHCIGDRLRRRVARNTLHTTQRSWPFNLNYYSTAPPRGRHYFISLKKKTNFRRL